MPRFEYIALDARGQESPGLIEASSSNEAIGQLRQAGYFPTNVVEEGKGRRAPKARKSASKGESPRAPRRTAKKAASFSSSARRSSRKV